MSYLEISEGIPEFSRAVISFWFRLPTTSVAAAAADDVKPAFTFILPWTIPLLTFGRPQIKKRYEENVENVVHYHYEPEFPDPIYDSPTYRSTADDPVNPCYIGINCQFNRPVLTVNIQTAGRASVSGIQFNRSRVDQYSSFGGEPPPAVIPGNGWELDGFRHTEIVDVSYIYTAQPEYFLVESSHVLQPDHWHHLLLSFDMSQPCATHGPRQTMNPFGSPRHETTAEGTTSSCRLWYAIDDVNYDGANNLNPYGVDGSSDKNAILTANAYTVANSQTSLPFNCYTEPASCIFAAQLIPSSKADFAIPASAKYVDDVHLVEMAEFQMWTGVTLDTGIQSNRRAFIDAEGKPENPQRAADLFGRKQDIMLHGSGNWKAGQNTGSFGIDGDGKPIASGQFVRKGVVKSYRPDPSLHGPQAPVAPGRRVVRRSGQNARL